MDNNTSDSLAKSNKPSKNGRPFLGEGLEGKELEDYLYRNKIRRKVVLKLTDYEYDKLQKKYNDFLKYEKIDRSSFLKNIIFNSDNSNVLKEKNNSNLVKEVNKIGVNINQLVKKVNNYKYLDNNIKYQIDNIKEELKLILNIVFKLK